MTTDPPIARSGHVGKVDHAAIGQGHGPPVGQELEDEPNGLVVVMTAVRAGKSALAERMRHAAHAPTAAEGPAPDKAVGQLAALHDPVRVTNDHAAMNAVNVQKAKAPVAGNALHRNGLANARRRLFATVAPPRGRATVAHEQNDPQARVAQVLAHLPELMTDANVMAAPVRTAQPGHVHLPVGSANAMPAPNDMWAVAPTAPANAASKPKKEPTMV